MWLEYGVTESGDFKSVAQVLRGKTDLKCPYCGGELTAKKGKIKTHHFAHTHQTCLAAGRSTDIPKLPCYDKFNLHLSGKDLKLLTNLWNDYGVNNWRFHSGNKNLIAYGLIKFNQYRGSGGSYEFTKKGKIPFGALSLNLFNQIQEPLILGHLQKLEEKIQRLCKDNLNEKENRILLEEALIDLKIYSLQIKRILSQNLYFLEINTQQGVFHKIDVTTRNVDVRMGEIQKELTKHFGKVEIKVLGTWVQRGNVEPYFKHRYKQWKFPIENLSEYFQFDDLKSVLRDLRRMKPKILEIPEIIILKGEATASQSTGLEALRKVRVSEAIKTGMGRAQAWGTKLGRPKGAESEQEFLSKPSTQRVVAALEKGLSLRKAALEAGVSVNTVRKVKALLK